MRGYISVAMALVCQFSAVAAATMVLLVLAAAIATLTSIITADQPFSAGSACFRKCVAGDVRTCHFHFDVHSYQTMSRACYNCPKVKTDCDRPECIPGDGIKRRILVVNKQMPGPPIQVCHGDRVVVDVKNSLHDESLTMHWHGLTMRAPFDSYGERYPGTPHMDGVPGITQCPIHSGSSFRYSFYASEAGTHFYHSHTGFQRGDGVFGAIIVRQPPADDPNHDRYDYDFPQHVIMFHDWLHMPTLDKFILRHHSGGDDFPESMLVNGQGPHQHAEPASLPALIPYKRFTVTAGNRYRMRLINTAVLNCPIVVSIDQHTLNIIAADGNPIVPVNATSLVVYPGERWDIVISFQQVNSINSACYDDLICVADLRSLYPLPKDLQTPQANFTFYLAFEMRRIHNSHFYSQIYYDFDLVEEAQQIPTPQINNLSLVLPATPMLLGGQSVEERICTAELTPLEKNCNGDYCECLHMYSIPLGSVVDLVLIDEGQYGDENHPIHLHGEYFWVLGEDRPNDVVDANITRNQVIEMDKNGELKRNFDHPVYKDTVTLPDGGYTVVRFHASNPGYWLLHCHLLFHSVSGMDLVIKIGNNEDMPKAPPDFPSCGSFKGSDFLV
ncbi:uncharacterized protein [Cherax quadricarinatus]